ncbi:signal peptidase II [Allocatelliglobosispora scoriae]|uniref:Lipoprotein signal peptidase n=1 Tax=Allocatelliglobosispora scoriae TaxID=643052 RepID=A0A841BL43_9ACTN|nr:signal peptidase II [Allocatelliglobosispora scoriae]MBB5868355.1 signal peptidase II [Allocatelliglobosispora scoriae]
MGQPADDRTASPSRTPRLFPMLLALAAGLVAVDQLTKWWAVAALTGRAPIDVIGELLRLRLTYNPGAAFSLGTEYTWVLTLFAAVAVVVIAYVARRVASRAWAVGFGLMLGGAFTHLLDRLFREPGFARGHVVDFIDYGPFVGNVADIALVVGVALIIVLNLRNIPMNGPAAEATPA